MRFTVQYPIHPAPAYATSGYSEAPQFVVDTPASGQDEAIAALQQHSAEIIEPMGGAR
jgi:hypothetical protein